MMARSLRDSVVVITGASSGIGRSTALEFARQGAKVVLNARDHEALESIAEECGNHGVETLIAAGDVSAEGEVENIAQQAIDKFQRIDVWVNNAAVLSFGRFDETPPDIFRRIVETDFYGYVHGARAAMPIFREQGSGVLINVSSLVGKLGQPYTSPYCASNFAIVGLGESLRAEVVDLPNVHVCTVLAGSVDTPFFHHAANYLGRAAKASNPIHDPQEVAECIVRLAQRPKPEAYVGMEVRMMTAAKGIARTAVAAQYARQTERDHFQPEATDSREGNLFVADDELNRVSGGWRELELERELHSDERRVSSTSSRRLTLPAVGASLAVAGFLAISALSRRTG